MTLDLRPASSLSTSELAALITAAYEDYVVPFAIDDAQFRFMVETFDLDLEASRVAFRDGEPVGLANLGVRAGHGWIGGVGVVPAARRQGVAEGLMEAVHEQARALGLREVWLEVIEQNEAAFRLYEKLGYELLRWVEIGTLEAQVPLRHKVRHVPWEEARPVVKEREPWQREDETLAHYDDLRGLAVDGGGAVYRVSPDSRVIVLQLGGGEPAARELLAALRAEGPVTLFNVPADDPALTAFRALGGKVSIRQREMVLTL